jgi:hypothetical protein
VLYDGDPTQVPPCPANDPTTEYHWNGGLVPEPAVCGACTCDPPPLSCTPQALSWSSDAACTSTSGSAVQPAPGSCGPIQAAAGTMAYEAAAPAGVAGACVTGGGGKTIPPPQWSRAGLACSGGGLGGGCSGGEICAPTPATPFAAGVCIWVANDFACPAGFPVLHTFTGTVTDTRDCTQCTCGAPTVQCSATTTIYTDGACSSATTLTVPDDGSCVAGAAGGSIMTSTSSSASCAPGGGTPLGTVTEGPTSTTVCCTM